MGGGGDGASLAGRWACPVLGREPAAARGWAGTGVRGGRGLRGAAGRRGWGRRALPPLRSAPLTLPGESRRGGGRRPVCCRPGARTAAGAPALPPRGVRVPPPNPQVPRSLPGHRPSTLCPPFVVRSVRRFFRSWLSKIFFFW